MRVALAGLTAVDTSKVGYYAVEFNSQINAEYPSQAGDQQGGSSTVGVYIGTLGRQKCLCPGRRGSGPPGNAALFQGSKGVLHGLQTTINGAEGLEPSRRSRGEWLHFHVRQFWANWASTSMVVTCTGIQTN